MKHQPPVIVLTGGGSGGHITPLLSLARELKARQPDCQILYIGYKGDNFDTFKKSGHDFDFMAFIKAGKYRRYHNSRLGAGLFDLKTLGLNIRDLFRQPGSIISAWRLLHKFQPDVVFSKGGFVALPVGVAARLLDVPVVTHDSDTMPGLTNRIIGRWAKVHATGMPAEFYSYPKPSTYFVGIPINEHIQKVSPRLKTEIKRKLGLPKDSLVLMVSGGGLGSQRLNKLMVSVAPELLQTHPGLYIIHLTGSPHEQTVKDGYKALSKPEQQRVLTMGFVNNFYAYSAAADLVITRAGATTLAELAAAGKACIVIPAPFLAGGHQLKNADDLAQKDAIVVAPDDVQADELLALITRLLNDDNRRFELARNLFATARPDATKDLAKLILKTAGVS